jgi:hypothetical protein
MLPPGSEDPAVAALPPGGDLYFEPARNLQNPGQVYFGGGRSAPTGAQSVDAAAPALYFGNSTTYTGKGEPIVQAKEASRGHVSEILNFHGSPAPWMLIGLLLVAGILHLSAEGKFGFGGRV